MTKLYLITGFLGSGKTTCLKSFIKLFRDKRIALIINEFGKEGIDGKLLADQKAALTEINNGSIFCVCRLGQFEQSLKDIMDHTPDVIIVETSGLSDPSDVRNILNRKDFIDIEYMGCICLIDALNFKKVYTTAIPSQKQVNISDIALINKTDLVLPDQIDEIRGILGNANPKLCIYETVFGEVKPGWLEGMQSSDIQGKTRSVRTQDITLQKHLVTVKDTFTSDELIDFIKVFMNDTYRIKGFVSIEGKYYLVDCVSDTLKVEPFNGYVAPDSVGRLVVLSGKGMPTRKSLKKAAELYSAHVD